jgi:hypothetical protein
MEPPIDRRSFESSATGIPSRDNITRRKEKLEGVALSRTVAETMAGKHRSSDRIHCLSPHG